MNDVLFIAAILILGLLVMFFVPQWRMKRAIPKVIHAFRKLNATSLQSARTAEELGLKHRGFLEGMMKGRDYKPFALDALTKIDVVLTTEDGRLYLSEEKLANSPIQLKIRIPKLWR